MSEFLIRLSSNLSAVSALALIFFTSAHVSAVTVEIDSPCTFTESWKFVPEDPIPLKLQNSYAAFLKKDVHPIPAFQEAMEWRKGAGASSRVQAFADYWMARALFSAEVEEIAAEKFSELVAQAPSADTVAIQVAAMGCVNEIHRKYPKISYSPQAFEKLAPYFKFDLSRELKLFLAEATAEKVLYQLRRNVDKAKIKETVDLLKGRGIFEFFAAGMAASAGDPEEASKQLSKFIDTIRPPAYIEQKRNELRLLLGHAYYDIGKFKESVEVLEKIDKTSNLLVPGLHALSWAHLMAENFTNAVGIAITFQTPNLRRTFAPETIMVSAIAMNELCLYPEALKVMGNFKRNYEKSYTWLSESQKKSDSNYLLVLNALKGVQLNVPDRIVSEWLRSPIFISNQTAINYLFKKKKEIPALLAESSAVPKFQELLRAYEGKIPGLQTQYRNAIEKELRAINKRAFEQLNHVMENMELIDAEITKGASQDLVYLHANPEYAEMVKSGKLSITRAPTGFSGKVYDWGKAKKASEAGEEEVWEDELGSVQVKLSDNCGSREKYLQLMKKK